MEEAQWARWKFGIWIGAWWMLCHTGYVSFIGSVLECKGEAGAMFCNNFTNFVTNLTTIKHGS